MIPIFDYYAVIWDSCNKTNRDYLDKLHRRAANIIEGTRSPSHRYRVYLVDLRCSPAGLPKMHASF